MSSFTPAWLPTGIARKAVVPAAEPRHRAPEEPVAESLATQTGADVRPGRHAEPEWSRQLFDAVRDDDPFEWLGFTAPTG
jgi:hypothetical protein